ncbi:MAG: methionyl-tRNA formyltransferase [Solirubrobacterales bacterium]
MRTAYFGTSEFAATVLRRLADSPHRPALAVTPPDRPKGRGQKVGPPPAAEAAREAGIEVLQAKSVNDRQAVERIRAAEPEVIAVCAFGQLITEPLLGEIEMLNVHPSLLPRWRGAAPIERALIAGDRRTGVTIMRVTEGLDSGPIALREEVEIPAGEDFASLEARLAELGGGLLVEALDRLERGALTFTEQDDDAATYAEKIEAAERRLDPARSAAELERVVRALGPRFGTHIELADGERLGVRAATAVGAGPAQGEIAAESARLVLGCSEGGLRLDVVQPPGKRAMEAEAFLRGYGAPARAS